MNRKTCSEFILKNINNLSLNDKHAIARILMFRECDLKQSNNGAYIRLDRIDDRTLCDIYDFIKYRF